MLNLSLKTNDHPEAQEIVMTLPDGGEIVVQLLPPRGDRPLTWGRILGIVAPADVRISRRAVRPQEATVQGAPAAR